MRKLSLVMLVSVVAMAVTVVTGSGGPSGDVNVEVIKTLSASTVDGIDLGCTLTIDPNSSAEASCKSNGKLELSSNAGVAISLIKTALDGNGASSSVANALGVRALDFDNALWAAPNTGDSQVSIPFNTNTIKNTRLEYFILPEDFQSLGAGTYRVRVEFDVTNDSSGTINNGNISATNGSSVVIGNGNSTNSANGNGNQQNSAVGDGNVQTNNTGNGSIINCVNVKVCTVSGGVGNSGGGGDD